MHHEKILRTCANMIMIVTTINMVITTISWFIMITIRSFHFQRDGWHKDMYDSWPTMLTLHRFSQLAVKIVSFSFFFFYEGKISLLKPCSTDCCSLLILLSNSSSCGKFCKFLNGLMIKVRILSIGWVTVNIVEPSARLNFCDCSICLMMSLCWRRAESIITNGISLWTKLTYKIFTLYR